MKHAIFVYSDIKADRNVFETAIKTLRKHSDCQIIVYSDCTPAEWIESICSEYDVLWLRTHSMEGRRALCKIESFAEHCHGLGDGECVGVFDADLYFMADPFEAFSYEFDIGLTARGYKYWSAINGGVIFFRINENTKRFLQTHVSESRNPTWPEYIEYRRKYNHERYGHDWTVGQDFLNCVWIHREWVSEEGQVQIVALPNTYNYCPAADLFGTAKAEMMIIKAYRLGEIKVLHLKSGLKNLLYEGVFTDTVLKHERGKAKWR